MAFLLLDGGDEVEFTQEEWDGYFEAARESAVSDRRTIRIGLLLNPEEKPSSTHAARDAALALRVRAVRITEENMNNRDIDYANAQAQALDAHNVKTKYSVITTDYKCPDCKRSISVG